MGKNAMIAAILRTFAPVALGALGAYLATVYPSVHKSLCAGLVAGVV